MHVKRGDVLETRNGRRFRVVRYRRHDDTPDTFRLESVTLGTVGNREWTEGDLSRLWEGKQVTEEDCQ